MRSVVKILGVEVQGWGITMDLAFGVGAIFVCRGVDRVLGCLVLETGVRTKTLPAKLTESLR